MKFTRLYDQCIVPEILERTMSLATVAKYRADTVKHVRGDILEIGFGTGLNLPHYPSGTRKITIVDDNPGLMRRTRQRIAASGIDVDVRILSAERLPFADASFDTVLSTWTMCSITDVAGAIAEVHRVLRPGGRFVFIEHGLSRVSSWTRFLQRALEPAQRVLGGNCHLTRDVPALMAASPFRFEGTECFNAERLPNTHSYVYRGIAAKGDAS